MSSNIIIVVDYQFDFADSKGKLYVKDGEKLKLKIEKFISEVKKSDPNCFIVASKDWHSIDHCSFVKNGGSWPVHCIAGTNGAELYFDNSLVDLIINKGLNKNEEEYSCIKNSEIKSLINKFDNIFVLGLAKDFCVKETALACITNNNVYIIDDLTKSVFPENDNELNEKLVKAKILRVNSEVVFEIIKGDK